MQLRFYNSPATLFFLCHWYLLQEAVISFENGSVDRIRSFNATTEKLLVQEFKKEPITLRIYITF